MLSCVYAGSDARHGVSIHPTSGRGASRSAVPTGSVPFNRTANTTDRFGARDAGMGDRGAASDEAERFALALDMYETGEAMLVQRLRRENPSATDEELEHAIQTWLGRRPGAESGDAEGLPGTWPRRPPR